MKECAGPADTLLQLSHNKIASQMSVIAVSGLLSMFTVSEREELFMAGEERPVRLVLVHKLTCHVGPVCAGVSKAVSSQKAARGSES